ncbi:putative NBD/HSP70 family sugar kinase [Hydrogenispora ethanolica]|jgi:predicted NBD/HSP70 family sugar kinase|uniref:Putative NBD/HSP70 family sugar kinase n=1 Tax=Hydrogenispora ethanolica TaxID=1082276 RepID=A0A4R1QX92_HYDET|nr:ROK family transcriptional regulator [Hydrogenispora ethanolica]TCL57865.1 putative NBD/HSP70 family sugar kinase [Hydrogenispora ethanolica]
MHHLKGENMGDLRKNNRSKILEILLKRSPISRAEISEISGLTPPTITVLVNELFREGLLEETGVETGKQVGRKRIQLQLLGNSKLALGVELGIRQLTVGLINLQGELLRRETLEIREKEPRAVIDRLLQAVRPLLADCPPEKLVGLGVGATGIVDSVSGLVKNSPNLGWRNFPLGALLERELDLPVAVDNNVRLMALGENTFFHNWGSVSRLILIHVGYGIGCGIILNGQLYSGREFGAGELGHTIIMPEGPLCSCGKFGCLETLASGRALTSAYAQKRGDEWDYSKTLRTLLAAGNQGEPAAVEIMDQGGTYMGYGLINLVNLFAPDLIILHGSIFDSTTYTQAALRPVTQNYFSGEEIPIKHSQAGDELVILGAGAMAIQKFLVQNELDAHIAF